MGRFQARLLAVPHSLQGKQHVRKQVGTEIKIIYRLNNASLRQGMPRLAVLTTVG